jgi:tetratricopeptide (TPR) repeat protein
MDNKDLVSISISSLAFALSLAATVISLIRGKYVKQRAIKKEIIDTLGKIVSTTIDDVRLFYEMAEKNPAYYQAISSIFSQQNAFLLNQATYLTDQVPHLVTAVEYNTIASATANAGDLITAEKYYKRAIEVSPSNCHRSLATRSYAASLFPQRRFEEGREHFRKAISLITGGDNMARFTNGFTYQMWALNELNNASSATRATDLFESAKIEFSGIDNELARRNAMNGLERAKDPTRSPGATAPSARSRVTPHADSV